MLSVVAPSVGKGEGVAEPPVAFAGVLRGLRTEAGLTQEKLAEAAGLTSRAISDLERGVVTIPHKDTVRLLADALRLDGPARAEFETVARGRAAPRHAGAGGAAPATRTLPRDLASFTGRRRELADLADAAAGAGGTVSIHAIGGMAGIGKTAFAVHAAHALAEQFPGGQIFLPLHAHTPGQRPVEPADALARLLLTIGIPAGQIPAGLEARMALWRDRVADRQLLLVLDDAAGSEQVRPLLPGAGGSLVLVTSRRRLSALEDARSISLNTLPPGDAARLLVRLAVRPGLSPADPAVAEIARLCGYLPLAIGMLARQLHHHPAWTVAGRAAELAAAVDRLDLLATENLSVAAAFDLSYADLVPDQRRLFRRLGLHPGADIDAYAAAALNGTGLAIACRGLEALSDQYLLTEPAPDRFRMHDLIREHARALAGRLDPDDDRDQATGWLLDYYQHTAARAESLITRHDRTAPTAAAGTALPAVPVLADREQALAWARAERASLLACLDHVTVAGQHARIIALTAGIAALLSHDGPWPEALTRHTAAMQAARHIGDRRGQADALTNLGLVRRLTGDYPAAIRDLEEALSIYRDTGNRLGQADALNVLGRVQRLTSDYPAAVRDLQEAFGIYRDLGDRLGQADILNGLGGVRLATGDYPDAARNLHEALSIYRDLGSRRGEVEALNESGTLSRARGDLGQARSRHAQALDLARQIGAAWDEAHALAGLGRCALAAGRTAEAGAGLRRALAIFQRIGAAETAEVSAELDALPGAPGSASTQL
jgi:tetratricopeptide (TPR) repeat protein/transcriptional regulator with XRE-family HTH domain